MRLEQNIEDETINNNEENAGHGITHLHDVDNGESNRPIVMNNEIDNRNEEGDDGRINYHIIEDTYDIFCANCRQKNCDELINNYGNECYTIEFRRYNSTAVKRRRRFDMLPSPFVRSSSTFINLCAQCGTHLTLRTSKENKKIYNSHGNSWPGFIWYILSNREFHDVYRLRLWQFIPLARRHWWLHEARNCFVEDISLNHPDSIFVDKSKEIYEWNREIGVMQIGNLRDVSNKLLMPCILCPWGCTEFLHK